MHETAARRPTRGPRPGRGGRAVMALARAVNPVLVRLAGAGLIPLWGLVRHRGRRSGRVYATPVAVLRTDDGFLIPLPFGEGTDWARNLLSAGGGVLRWKGT